MNRSARFASTDAGVTEETESTVGFISADVHREHLGEEAEADTNIAQEVSHWHGDEELKEEVKATGQGRRSR